ncbi:MAG: DNA-binding protein [Eubacteriales Family XIII. Incertae Sedis bacterium]|nr:MAG: DNA-binding protein [Clostridiales Family XIII bacterium]
MARPSKCRRICSEPAYDSFAPGGICCGDKTILTVDEYEVIRLIDLHKLTHEQCAKQMDISRTTVTEIYEAAREKIADSIVNGKKLVISGGNYRLCDGSAADYCQKFCRKIKSTGAKTPVRTKGANTMRIAVTYENGEIFQHFGHTEQFKIYDITDGKITDEQIINTNGSGHGALAGLLTEIGADVIICGGIGSGAKSAIAEAGIKLYGGVSGNADAAVKALMSDSLDYNPDVHCDHHDHAHGHECGNSGHSCHSHNDGGHCGEDKHGCAGNGGHCH